MTTKPPFGFKTPKDSQGFLLWQATVTWQRYIRQVLDPHHITHPQFVLMALLLWLKSIGDTPTQTLLIEWSKLDKMTVSKSLLQLEKKKLVSRTIHKTDTRAKAVALTTKGEELVHILVPKIEAVDSEFFSGISNQTRVALKYGLQSLSEKRIDEI